jgi:hypothetical protein
MLDNFAGETPFSRASSCHVIVDYLVICGPADFKTALAVMFGSYFVVNIAYPKNSVATLKFVQQQVFHLTDGFTMTSDLTAVLYLLLNA